MFHSATLKLTAWYLAILMSISILFSFAIYQITSNELNARLQNLEAGLLEVDINLLTTPALNTDEVRLFQARQANEQMIVSLFYINLFILVAGGIGSYLLARQTLLPLEKAHDAQRRFTSDASHELRTPLAAMKTELEVALRDKSLTMGEARELMESNLEETNKMIRMAEVFLKLARLDYDAVERKPMDTVSTLEDVLKQFKNDAKRLEVNTRKTSTVIANEPAISELMSILIDNALKYSTEGSTVTIRIYEKRLWSYFSVTNQGPTIPKDKIPQLFERFYRGDQSRTASAKNGYGLGLAIAKRISDVHKADLRVRSLDGTTTFSFSLPTKRAREQANSGEAAEDQTPSPKKKK